MRHNSKTDREQICYPFVVTISEHCPVMDRTLSDPWRVSQMTIRNLLTTSAIAALVGLGAIVTTTIGADARTVCNRDADPSV